MKLFLDANVIFSAAHREAGRSQDLIAPARGALCGLDASTHAGISLRGTLVATPAVALDLVLKGAGV